ncbi:MAG: 30S ribosomal protein S9 [Candidatus Micrarchaeaceae archaeon]
MEETKTTGGQMATLQEQQPAAAATSKKLKQAPQKRRKAKPAVILTKGKRKSAVARARLIKGSGSVRINGKDINVINPKEIRELMLEPINFSALTKQIASNYDISVNVSGGGVSGEAQAVRTAIAKAIAEAANSDVVAKAYMKHDRTLLIDDTRRVEPKKFLGPKARARFQTSYR